MEKETFNKQKWLNTIKSRGGRMAVNRKWCPQLKDHVVLRKLIKEEKLRRVRYGSKFCKVTYLELIQI